jgi:glycosyltransferase involved in cell wall biosynthesis
VDALPTVDLVVGTVGRPAALRELLDSLAAQTHRPTRVIVVDQSADDAVRGVVESHPAGLEIVRLSSPPGLSRARNAGLAAATATLVGFPDDDCTYPADLLARVAAAFAADPALDLLTGRTAEPSGLASERWPEQARTIVASDVWHAGNSASTFLRRALLKRVGPFDERLGLGSGTPWTSGEDIDLLLRALAAGAVARQDPSLVVHHRHHSPTGEELVELGRRDGGSVGFLLGRHALGARVLVRMLVRPLGGIVSSLARGDVDRARFHAATWRGRLRGYRAGRAATG